MKHKIEEGDVYDDLFEHVMHLLNEHGLPVELVASALMAIGQRLYRTHLTDQGYDAMMDMIRDYPVEPYKVTKERLH
jgi:hypothetical protein